MSKIRDLTGQRFGRLTVLCRAQHEREPSGKSRVYWTCQCDCGNIATVCTDNLVSGRQVSCGCYMRAVNHDLRTTHGETDTRLYNIWLAMKRRCDTPSLKAYPDYGGRGITVCDEWVNSYESFRDWSLANGYNEKLSIDRINNNGNYEPDNCRWVDCVAQANNRRSNVILEFNGESHNITEWARILGKNPKTLYSRRQSGDSVERILRT